MRVFVSLPIPNDICEKLSQVCREIADDGIAPVRPEKMHITLRFIGETDKTTEISEQLWLVSFEPFRCLVRSLGVFPNRNYVRIIWAGLKSDEQLELLSEKINSTLKNFSGDDRFSPHITIARVKKKIDLDAFLIKYQQSVFGEFEVSEFHLVRSTLTQSGPRYSIISKYHCNH